MSGTNRFVALGYAGAGRLGVFPLIASRGGLVSVAASTYGVLLS